jgi:hypothetical protein
MVILREQPDLQDDLEKYNFPTQINKMQIHSNVPLSQLILTPTGLRAATLAASLPRVLLLSRVVRL